MIILCDPVVTEIVPDPGIHELKGVLFREGYTDFLPTSDRSTARSMKRHHNSSMRRDLCYCFKNQIHHFSHNEWINPDPTSIFVQKVVAATCLEVIELFRSMLPSLELRLTTAWIEELEQLVVMRAFHSACWNYVDDVESILLNLNYAMPGEWDGRVTSLSCKPANGNWKDCEKDFQYIYVRMEVLKERVDGLLTSMIELIKIATNRLDIDGMKRIERVRGLTLILFRFF